MGRLSQQGRDTIRTLLEEGYSHNSISKKMGCSQSTVSRLATREGIECINPAPMKAVYANKDYSKANRVALLNKMFERGEQMIDTPGLTARDYKDLMLGFAVGIDKRRLEDGEASKVTEQRGGLDLEAEFKQLDKSLRKGKVPNRA